MRKLPTKLPAFAEDLICSITERSQTFCYRTIRHHMKSERIRKARIQMRSGRLLKWSCYAFIRACNTCTSCQLFHVNFRLSSIRLTCRCVLNRGDCTGKNSGKCLWRINIAMTLAGKGLHRF